MLCDFGLAMILQDVFTHPLTESRYSTPRFSAPELMEDSGPIPPPRTKFTDVWAFGCTGMQISCGIEPYDGFTRNKLVTEMNHNMTPPYQNFNNNPLESVFEQCLMWYPEDRIMMSKVVEQLEAALSLQYVLPTAVGNIIVHRPQTIFQLGTSVAELN